MLIFPLKDFILAFRYFSMYTGSLSNSFLILFVTFSQISFHSSTNSSFYIKKDIHLVSLKSLLYALISGRNIHKGLFFSIFVGNGIFKTFSIKKDYYTTIRYYYYINIYIFYWNRSFMLVEFLFFDFMITKFYNCFL